MAQKKLYNILEVANTHNGNIDYIFSLIDEFKNLRKNFGIKFQVFKYDLISTEKFKWYTVYKKLFFNEEQWDEIISKASETKDVWLDIFDSYSVVILKNNNKKIKGIKFQASTLKNYSLIEELKSLNIINRKEVILNVSGYDINQIKSLINHIESKIKPKKIIIQVGFQDYPTKLEHSGLCKIQKLKENLPYEISFADHLSFDDPENTRLPIVAYMLGATYIEKHIKHSSLETIYDNYSSVNIFQYQDYLNTMKRYINSINAEFISKREKVYLQKSIQSPVTSKKLYAGKSIDLGRDLSFKRNNKIGISFEEIEELNNSFYILNRDVNQNEPLIKKYFKKAKIATIIAVRMKSSRLPKKALLKIGELTSIETCIKNCLKFDNVDYTVVATSDLEEDRVLQNYTYDKSVIFHQGDANDVIQRYLDVVNKLNIDVVIRVTGDCPFISNDILQIVLKSHFNSGADYSCARKAAIGTNIEIINAISLRKVKKYFPSANYSEYMTYYFTNNPNHFRLNFVDLPAELIRNYRLTLDYQEDLDLFNDIAHHFGDKDYNIKDIFAYLDNNSKKANINSHCLVKYFTDHSLINEIKTHTTITIKS